MTKGTLYPPLETKDSSEGSSTSMLLSMKLKRSFDTVHHIHHSQKRLKERKVEGSDEGNEEKRKAQRKDLEARKFEAALAAAVAAESEISALTKGITELESILLHNEPSDSGSICNEKFPILPREIEEGSNYINQDNG